MQCPKPSRIKNRELLDAVKKQPCCVCRSQKNIDPSHIASVGSGGHDVEANLVPHCRRHHSEWHELGPFKFFEKYPSFAIHLCLKGWEIDFVSKKLFHEGVR
jgi:hypothetical protein